MSRGWKIALVMLLIGSASSLPAQTPAPTPAKKGPATSSYAVLAKVSRAAMLTDDKGRSSLEQVNVTLPEIVSIEGTRAEYVNEKKIEMGVYQFRLQVQVVRMSETKVRLDFLVEDVSSEGNPEQPTVYRKSLHSTRLVTLGNKLKLTLDEKNDRGEGVWVELTVKEAPEDD